MSTTNSEAPTWYGDVKDLFTNRDISCMQGVFGTAYNLGSYQFVATHANQIDQVTASGYMPKGGTPWTEEMTNTFRTWIANDFPEGTPDHAVTAEALETASGPTRVRKDIRSLNGDDIEKLATAFDGIMNLPSDDPNSYFHLASIHWLPAPNFFCMHHDPGFLSWHRAYQIMFEDALRTIEGCEDITLPYWDITMDEELPPWLYEAPFASYTFPQDVGLPKYPQGYVTQRYSASDVLKNLRGNGTHGSDVFTDVANAMTQTTWEGFNGFFANADYDTLIAGHDNGHNSTGPTMADQSVAAFDPIFWFFHNNWDRVFWEWQKEYNATTQEGLLSRITGDQASHDTFSEPVPAQLSPFTSLDSRLNAIDLIDLYDWDIEYAPSENPPDLLESTPITMASGSKTLHAAESFTMDQTMVHVRVEGINRIRIPGSFQVHLKKDDKVIGTRSLFQPSNVSECENCIKNAIVHFDFKLPASEVADGKLSLWIEPADKELGDSIPLASLGTPTIEVRIPLNKKTS